MKTIYYINALILFYSCHLLHDGKNKCNLVKVETIFSDVATRNNTYPRYIHHVLIEGYSKNCIIDSTEFFNVVKHYLDTVNLTTKPISFIYFYSSKDNFIPSETSQVWDDIYKDCIVGIKFDARTYKPLEFKFYDKNGKVESRTKQWKKYD